MHAIGPLGDLHEIALTGNPSRSTLTWQLVGDERQADRAPRIAAIGEAILAVLPGVRS